MTKFFKSSRKYIQIDIYLQGNTLIIVEMHMKHFPTNSLLLLGPLFVLATDFALTRFSLAGSAKKLARKTTSSSPSSSYLPSYNPRAYRSSWIQEWEESKDK